MGCRLPVADSVAGCRFSCRFETDNISSKNRQPATRCHSPIQLPIRNRQVQRIDNPCRFRFETDNISSMNRQPATSCRLPTQLPIRIQTSSTNQIRNRQYKSDESATGNDSLNLSVSNRQVNRQPVTAGYWFVELILSVLNLNRRLSVRGICLFRIGNWIGNRQPATELATGCLGPYIVSFESATESATCNWIGNRQPATNC